MDLGWWFLGHALLIYQSGMIFGTRYELEFLKRFFLPRKPCLGYIQEGGGLGVKLPPFLGKTFNFLECFKQKKSQPTPPPKFFRSYKKNKILCHVLKL